MTTGEEKGNAGGSPEGDENENAKTSAADAGESAGAGADMGESAGADTGESAGADADAGANARAGGPARPDESAGTPAEADVNAPEDVAATANPGDAVRENADARTARDSEAEASRGVDAESGGETETETETETEVPSAGPDPASEPAPPSAPSRLRRVLRSRVVLAATVFAVVGALVGAGTVAWRTDTLPLLKPDPCWDSLREAGISGLFGDRRLEVDEQELRRDPGVASLSYGQCRITSFDDDDGARRQAIVRVHVLDSLYGKDSSRWPAEFLTSRMVGLGDGLPGMVSASRGWLALPQSCVGRSGYSDGPTVVDVALGEHLFDAEGPNDRRDREAMTHVLVDAANGALRDMGCGGTYQAPAKLPALPQWDETKPADFCGVRGLRLPAAHRESLTMTRVGDQGGAARVCESGRGPEAKFRMSTVVDPELAKIYSRTLRQDGIRVEGTQGGGTIAPRRAMYQLSCQTGDVVMLVEDLDSFGDDPRLVRDLLPAYVKSESARIGCGRTTVKLPAP